MKYGRVVFFLILVGVVLTAYSRMKDPHQFSDDECRLCHVDAQKDPGNLKPVPSSVCEKCHAESRQKLSHPIDVAPETSMPADMPLEDGKLSCITCHFVHPFSIKYKRFTYFLLRRPGKGAPFCSACHRIDAKGHIVFENLHQSSYQATDRGGSLDRYTLQCIQCHDDRIDNPGRALGAGRWQHFAASRLNHPVGISYAGIANKNPRKFNPAPMLPDEIRFFNGKIGCGTCHNTHSKEKSMLVMSNWRSSLCLVCHIK